MVSTVQSGRGALARMSLYQRLMGVGPVSRSYARKFALAAFIGICLPLVTFVAWLLTSRFDIATMYPALAALFLACFMGFLGTLWALRELLVPVDLATEAQRAYLEHRQLPDLPVGFRDTAGRLMEGTQYTLTQLDETIKRLEKVSDTDDLTGVYNRRSGDKRLAEEIARAERDLQAFQLAIFDIRGLAGINQKHGHSAGDACISHLADLLQLNTRRGDWVARWGPDEFLVGLHRNRALKMVMERIVKAIGASPCEIAPGLELRVVVSAGVAEYRFGTGVDGALGDVQKALQAARVQVHAQGHSMVAYRNELDAAGAARSASPA